MNWNKKVLPVLIEQLELLNAEGITPTLRSMYYRLLSLGLFRNGPKNPYQYLSSWTGDLRRYSIFDRDGKRPPNDGETDHKYQLPMHCFSDETRNVIRGWNDYTSPEKYLDQQLDTIRSFPQNFKGNIPRWYKQEHYVEVWVEKRAMIKTLQNILGDKQVRIVPFSGYQSVPFIHDNMERIEKNVYFRGSKLVHILYLGDMDPSGEDIDLVTREALKDYEIEEHVDFKRIGVTMDQIEEWDLPQDPDAMTEVKLNRDPRGKKFKARHKGKLFQVEVDALAALRPTEFKECLLKPIDDLFRQNVYEEVMNDASYSEEELKKMQKEKVNELYNEIIGKDTQS
jgi:hypothetical protein